MFELLTGRPPYYSRSVRDLVRVMTGWKRGAGGGREAGISFSFSSCVFVCLRVLVCILVCILVCVCVCVSQSILSDPCPELPTSVRYTANTNTRTRIAQDGGDG